MRTFDEGYNPENLPYRYSTEELGAYLVKELRRVGIALAQSNRWEMPALAVEPAKPREGMTVQADGTNWDPGEGAGVYQYTGGVWVKQTTQFSDAQYLDLTDGGNTTLHKHTHNSQDGLQGGTTNEYNHSTNAEYAGTGTGVFVRKTSPTLGEPTFEDTSDTTKKVAMQLSMVTTGTTRTRTEFDLDGASALAGTGDPNKSPRVSELGEMAFADFVVMDAGDATRQPRHGIDHNADGTYKTTIAYNETTRVVTLTAVAPAETIDFWVFGVKYSKASPYSFTAHAATGANHFVYFDASGEPAVSTTAWDVLSVVPVCFVFQDATNGRRIPFDERHHAGADAYWHRNQHFAEGTKATAGFTASDITGYTLSTGTDAACTFAIASGTIEDEDIKVTTEALPDNGPYNILERVGASGEWQLTRTNTVPFFRSGTTLQYNQNNGGTWQRTTVANSEFVNYYVFGCTALPVASITPSPLATQQIVVIPGQAKFTSLPLAHGETVANITFGTIPFQEIVPLYKLTYKFSSGGGGTVSLEAVTKIVGTAATIAASVPTDHGTLSGLSDPDHPASAIINTPAGNISATDVQAAINELDTEKQPIDATLTALAALDGTAGILTQTGVDTFVRRSLVAPAAGLTISNPAGTSGDPTFALANDLSALEGLSSTGLAARTGTDAWAQRTITGTTNEISVANGAGTAGNPTISLPSALTLTSKTVTSYSAVGPSAVAGTDDVNESPRMGDLGSAAFADLSQVQFNVWPLAVSSAYAVSILDNGRTLVVSGTTTVTLPAASAVFDPTVPFAVCVKAITGATVTVARTGSDTIETVAGNKSMTANTALWYFPTSTSAWETI